MTSARSIVRSSCTTMMIRRRKAEAAIKRVVDEGLYREPIVTQVEPLEVFYPGEDYHQQYFRSNPGASYCQVIIERRWRSSARSIWRI